MLPKPSFIQNLLTRTHSNTDGQHIPHQCILLFEENSDLADGQDQQKDGRRSHQRKYVYPDLSEEVCEGDPDICLTLVHHTVTGIDPDKKFV